jgi:hypothetical protein
MRGAIAQLQITTAPLGKKGDGGACRTVLSFGTCTAGGLHRCRGQAPTAARTGAGAAPVPPRPSKALPQSASNLVEQ